MTYACSSGRELDGTRDAAVAASSASIDAQEVSAGDDRDIDDARLAKAAELTGVTEIGSHHLVIEELANGSISGAESCSQCRPTC